MPHVNEHNECLMNNLMQTPSLDTQQTDRIFAQLLVSLPNAKHILNAELVDTPLGPMIAIADDKLLYLLEFIDGRGIEREIKRLSAKTHSSLVQGKSPILTQIKTELQQYFAGELREFKTPLHLSGSPFQTSVWQELMRIPYGITRSYGQQAAALSKPTAFRAVANANGANQLAIIIPCHRIINTNGKLGGYGGGIERKQWLLDHERQHKQ